MKVLGISLLKNELRYSVLTGTKTKPILERRERVVTPDPLKIPLLMDWFDTNFNDLLTTVQPDKIAYKISLQLTLKQLGYLAYPYGVLNLVAKKANKPIEQYSSAALRGLSNVGIKGKVDPYSVCDSTFGLHPPYWDKDQKDSILVAWFEL